MTSFNRRKVREMIEIGKEEDATRVFGKGWHIDEVNSRHPKIFNNIVVIESERRR